MLNTKLNFCGWECFLYWRIILAPEDRTNLSLKVQGDQETSEVKDKKT